MGELTDQYAGPSSTSPGGSPMPEPWLQQWREEVFPTLLALLSALLLFQAICLLYGQAPLEVLRALWAGTVGTGYGLGQVLFKATPLIFTGLSVSVAFRAGLFNIGGEGQAALGALAMGITGAALPENTSALIAVPACLLAGSAAGGAWGLLAGWMKGRFGAHEVITTIMLNFLAFAFSGWLVMRFLKVGDTLHTSEISVGAQLPRLERISGLFTGSAANLALALALLLAPVVHGVLFYTTFGFRLRTQGLAPSVAEYAGGRTRQMTLLVMAFSGALAGCAGSSFVLGYKHYHEEGFSGGIGFLGIAVALLGRSHPVGVVVAALLFGLLSQGGLAVNARIPKDTMDVLQAVIILGVAIGSRLKKGADV